MEYQAIAEALGLDEGALYRLRWRERSKDKMQGGRHSRGLVAVRVAPKAASETFVVHGPVGVRVEGLTLDDLVALLRRLS
jgi:hypothetical protein